MGCNDYIKKPFSPKELKYRVEQLIKLFYAHNNQHIQISQNSFYDVIAESLYYENNLVSLTKKENQVVFCLLSNENQYVSFEKLREEVWDDKFICEADIRVCIKKIRDKTCKEFILNQRGIGYKIVREK